MIYAIWIGLAIVIGIIGNNKKICFGWALFWSLLLSPLIGLIIVLASDGTSKSQLPEYKKHRELGEKAEFKEKFKEAVEHYKDSLYHLEKDYQGRKLSKKLEEGRQKQIREIKSKIEAIKANNPNLFAMAKK